MSDDTVIPNGTGHKLDPNAPPRNFIPGYQSDNQKLLDMLNKNLEMMNAGIKTLNEHSRKQATTLGTLFESIGGLAETLKALPSLKYVKDTDAKKTKEEKEKEKKMEALFKKQFGTGIPDVMKTLASGDLKKLFSNVEKLAKQKSFEEVFTDKYGDDLDAITKALKVYSKDSTVKKAYRDENFRSTVSNMTGNGSGDILGFKNLGVALQKQFPLLGLIPGMNPNATGSTKESIEKRRELSESLSSKRLAKVDEDFFKRREMDLPSTFTNLNKDRTPRASDISEILGRLDSPMPIANEEKQTGSKPKRNSRKNKRGGDSSFIMPDTQEYDSRRYPVEPEVGVDIGSSSFAQAQSEYEARNPKTKKGGSGGSVGIDPKIYSIKGKQQVTPQEVAKLPFALSAPPLLIYHQLFETHEMLEKAIKEGKLGGGGGSDHLGIAEEALSEFLGTGGAIVAGEIAAKIAGWATKFLPKGIKNALKIGGEGAEAIAKGGSRAAGMVAKEGVETVAKEGKALSRFAKRIPFLGTLLAAGFTAVEIYDIQSNGTLDEAEKSVKTAGAVGGLGFGLAGASMGASLGIPLGPAGMLIGGLIGGLIGEAGGRALGEAVMTPELKEKQGINNILSKLTPQQKDGLNKKGIDITKFQTEQEAQLAYNVATNTGSAINEEGLNLLRVQPRLKQEVLKINSDKKSKGLAVLKKYGFENEQQFFGFLFGKNKVTARKQGEDIEVEGKSGFFSLKSVEDIFPGRDIVEEFYNVAKTRSKEASETKNKGEFLKLFDKRNEYDSGKRTYHTGGVLPKSEVPFRGLEGEVVLSPYESQGFKKDIMRLVDKATDSPKTQVNQELQKMMAQMVELQNKLIEVSTKGNEILEKKNLEVTVDSGSQNKAQSMVRKDISYVV